MTTLGIATVVGAAWGCAATGLAFLLGRAIKLADRACPCDALDTHDDWLAVASADCLSDVEIADRFERELHAQGITRSTFEEWA